MLSSMYVQTYRVSPLVPCTGTSVALVLPGIWTHFTRARLRDQIHLLLLHHPSRSQSNLSTPDTMAAIKSLMTRDEVVHQLVKRKNWAAREPGVIVVFCIVGVVAIGLLSLFLYRKAIARKANKASTV
ncbi:hypothetical protein FVER53590_02740 [Fusarium verticillioides]|nr:hypothetical protein FVER53590_02740 [Fusarium verticillioides]